MLYRVLRAVLFLLPAEFSHVVALKGLRLLHRLGLLPLLGAPPPASPVRVLGLEFANPVGLAAGLDKNADYLDALGALGFGFVEVGTVTPRPQDGNPRPRLFRLAGERAIINRMGFNNKGLAHMVERLGKRRYAGVVGVNIGKNRDTPVEQAVDDYLVCLRGVYPLADYVVVNLSSPNTPGLRALQFGSQLQSLLGRLKMEQSALKVAPDLTDDEIVEIARVVQATSMDGLIVNNTTVSRIGVETARHGAEVGGLSGAPLTRMSTRVLEKFAEALNGTLPLIGVGGIMTGEDAGERFRAGASLVQLYSGFIFTGPALLHQALAAYREGLPDAW